METKLAGVYGEVKKRKIEIAGDGQRSRSGSSGGSAEAKRDDPATAGVVDAGPEENVD